MEKTNRLANLVGLQNGFRKRWESSVKTCDIAIPVWNELESTKKCVERLKGFTRYPYRLTVVDNGSGNLVKGYLEGIKKDFLSYRLIRNEENLGFVKAVNQAMALSDADYFCVLNNDAYVSDGWLKDLIETVESGPGNIGLANPTSNIFGKSAPDGSAGEFQELDSCKGFCLLIKKEVIEKIGFFDEIFGMGYFEEKDFSRRAIEAGFICVRAKSSFVSHKDRLSFNKLKNRDEIFQRNELIYNERWGRPESIAFVAKDKKAIEDKKELIYYFLKKGDRINVFFPKNFPSPELKDHIEIRLFPMTEAFFFYATLFKIWKRRRKKKIGVIISETKEMNKFFNRFRFLHGARVT